MDDLDLGATIKGFSPGQKIFNRYTLGRILGRGGMGVVWLVRDASMERDIAIKMLPEVVANDPSAIRELKRETSRSQQLSHANILRIYDFAEGAGVCGITMELVDGHTLATLRHERPGEVFSVEELTPVVRQLCAALDYAHTDARIVHRDLKPANLMLDRTGRLKVMDFGIAASLSESVSRVSNRASTSGSPGYMSPQQWRGIDPMESDDLYALGATLYELLAGQPPFKSPQPAALMHQVLHEPPLPLNARRAKAGQPPVPAAWEETIMALLAKEPGDRPSSAGEVVERLGLGGMATRSPKSAKIEVGAVAPNRPAVERTLPATQANALEATRSTKTPLIAGIVAVVLLLAGLGYYFGVYAPEQTRLAVAQKQRAAEEARLAEIKRLEDEGKAAEAQKLKNQQELAAAEAKAQSERERLAVERLAAARGGIVVRTTPAGAEVRVGAIALEKSPLTLKDQKLGKYPVRVRLEGYEEWTGEVEVKENDFSDLDVALVRSTGKVVLNGPAGATVTAEGRTIGTLPLTLDRVPTGTVRYAVALKGHKSAEVTGELSRNTELRLNAALEKQTYPQPGQTWENTLGQKFVPVPGTGVLFCIWETRVQDFAAFVQATGHDATQGMFSLRKGNWGQHGDSWKSPGFTQSNTHPVVGVNEDDAKAFCAWLTKQERAAGRLAADQEYRLPTDAEWDAAVGKDEFPWGGQWPPPKGAGNYAGSEAKDADWNSAWGIIEGYNDGYARTAPVGSFSANRHGIHDLGGNVWERVGDRSSGVRGASFGIGVRRILASAFRNSGVNRSVDFGFRVVCAVGSAR